MVRMEKELNVMESTLLKMWGKVIHMHEKVVIMLATRNRDIALEIVQADDFINHLEEEVNEIGLSVLALLSPVASDLRRVISSIKIASELERIADYAKNIGIFILRYDEMNQTVIEYAQEMDKAIIEMLVKTKVCYIDRDVEAAFEIPQQDKLINHLEKELNEKLSAYNDVEMLKQVLSVGCMFRSLERAGDHIKNICEHIIYLMKGQYYDFG